jgi:hypothetical protein
MIQFNCHRCHRPLEVSEDEVGSSLQCPGCGYLIDVPTLNDIQHLQQDGTYEMVESIPAKGKLPDNRKLPSLMEHDELDRRATAEEFLAIGVTPEELAEQRQEVAPGVPKAPKYDPITGELLTPIELKSDRKPGTPPPMVALPASVADRLNPNKTLSYARASLASKTGREEKLWYPYVGMFKIANLAVWLLVTFMLGGGVFLQIFPFLALLFMYIIWPALMLICICHVANTVDETGPTGRDEMPVPLRQLSWVEDIWRPLVYLFVSWFLATLPLTGFRVVTGQWPPLYAQLPLEILFYFVFPALLMTTVCSGALNNLLPHRSLGIIPIIGWRYLLPVVAFAGGYVLLVGSLNVIFASISLAAGMSLNSGPAPTAAAGAVAPAAAGGGFSLAKIPVWVFSAAALPVLAVGVYLLHVACWQMGLLYRRYNERFPWVWQKHVKTDRKDMLAQLKNRRAEQQAEMSREAMQKIEEKKLRLLQGAAQR